MRRRLATLPPLPGSAPMLILAVAAVASVVVLLALCSGMTFFQDEWHVLIHRRGFNADAFFLPNDVHPVVLPVAIYKLGLAVFGMTSVGPERVFATLLYAGTAVLLFLYVRRRLGDWLALLPALLLLFLGPAWNVLLWPFEISLVGSVAAGLAMLLALDRDDRSGDILACALLVAAVGFSSLGVPFALAAGVDVLLRHRTRGWKRIYVPAVALALYAIWYLTYGNDVPSALTISNVTKTPLFVAESIASSLASLAGLSTTVTGQEGGVDWGRPLLIGIVVLAAIWLRRHRPSGQIWVVVTAAAAFWILAGFDFVPGREPTASRYQYIGAVFVVLILAEVFRGARLSNKALLVLGGLTCVALLSNLAPLRDGRDFMKEQSDLARGELAAIEIARDTVSPDFTLTPDIAGTATLIPIDAGSYLSAVKAFGSPAESQAELPSASEAVRKQVDTVLANAVPVTLDPLPQGLPPSRHGAAPAVAAGTPGAKVRGSCLEIAPGAAAAGLAATLHGDSTIRIGPGAPVAVGLRRYADEFGLNSSLEGGSASLLKVPGDRSDVPWQISLTGTQATAVCTR